MVEMMGRKLSKGRHQLVAEEREQAGAKEEAEILSFSSQEKNGPIHFHGLGRKVKEDD